MKYKCNMIQDLMPLCIDNAASEESRQSVIEHLSECTKCENYYEMLTHEFVPDYKPDEATHNYAVIAKKLRRKKAILRIALSFAAGLFIMICVNYAIGYRLTPKAASQTDGKVNFASGLIGEYDWGNWQFHIYDCTGYYITATVQKTWMGWINHSNIFTYQKRYGYKPIENIGALYFWSDTDSKGGIQIFPVICHDEKVSQIEVSFFGKTEKKEITPGELTIFALENSDSTLKNTATGKAYDAFGNVLYELQENEYLEWEWVPCIPYL